MTLIFVAIRISSDIYFMFLCLCTIVLDLDLPKLWLPGHIVAHSVTSSCFIMTNLRPTEHHNCSSSMSCAIRTSESPVTHRTSKLLCHHKKCSITTKMTGEISCHQQVRQLCDNQHNIMIMSSYKVSFHDEDNITVAQLVSRL